MKSSSLLLFSCLWPFSCSLRTPVGGLVDNLPLPLEHPDDASHDAINAIDSTAINAINAIPINAIDTIQRPRPRALKSLESGEDEDCLMPGQDPRTYAGNISTTRRGYTCKSWSGSSYPAIGEHKFCRQPSNYDHFTVWCYGSNGFDYCDIPICVIYTKGNQTVQCLPTCIFMLS